MFIHSGTVPSSASLAGFLLYVLLVGAGAVALIFYASPRWGQRCARAVSPTRTLSSRIVVSRFALRVPTVHGIYNSMIRLRAQEPIHLRLDHRLDWFDHRTLLQDDWCAPLPLMLAGIGGLVTETLLY